MLAFLNRVIGGDREFQDRAYRLDTEPERRFVLSVLELSTVDDPSERRRLIARVALLVVIVTLALMPVTQDAAAWLALTGAPIYRASQPRKQNG